MDLKFYTVYICCFVMKNGYTSAPLAIFKNKEDAIEYTMNGNEEQGQECRYFYYRAFVYEDYNWNPKKTNQ